jgi:hypothetical protein
MSSFSDSLNRILSEMPLRHHKAVGKEPDPTMDRFQPLPHFMDKTYEGYVSPRLMEVLSEKLSRMSGHNFNIFVIDVMNNPGTSRRTPRSYLDDLDQLSKFSGVPIEELSDAINVIMAGNNGQTAFSPWLYMHQIGEAFGNSVRNIEDTFEEFIDEIIAAAGENWFADTLKMGSARQAKEGIEIADPLQELMTEYLWHGGRIRIVIPKGADKAAILNAYETFSLIFEELLDKNVGDIIRNQIQA